MSLLEVVCLNHVVESNVVKPMSVVKLALAMLSDLSLSSSLSSPYGCLPLPTCLVLEGYWLNH